MFPFSPSAQAEDAPIDKPAVIRNEHTPVHKPAARKKKVKCTPSTHEIFSELIHYYDARVFAARKQKLLDWIGRWQRLGSRTTPEILIRQQRVTTAIKLSLRFDRPWVVMNYLTPITYRVRKSYAYLARNELGLEHVSLLKAKLKESGFSPEDFSDLQEMIQKLFGYSWNDVHEPKEFIRKTIAQFKLPHIPNESDTAGVGRVLDMTQTLLAKDAQIQAEIIARNMDDYAHAFNLLHAVADKDVARINDLWLPTKGAKAMPVEGSIPPETLNAMSVRAQFILDRLKSEYLLDEFFIKARMPPQATPTIKDIYKVLDRYPDAELARLGHQCRAEFLHTWVVISPTEKLFSILEGQLAHIPGVKRGKIREFLRVGKDEVIRYTYFPDIERILDGVIDPKLRLEMLETLSLASPDPEGLLVTFARLVDSEAVDAWKILLKEAETSGNQRFLERMQKAVEKANKLPLLSLKINPTSRHALTRFLDLAVAYASGKGLVAGGGKVKELIWPGSSEPNPSPGTDREHAALREAEGALDAERALVEEALGPGSGRAH